MAIIWQKTKGNTRYEVRSAGATLRLYTNGAFHSQYNPNHLFTGGIWDLLVIPALFSSALNFGQRSDTEVLILGVGGGAAIHLFNELLSQPPITGIEYDKIHLDIARNHFHCHGEHTQLIHADAYDWVNKDKNKYSILLDDLFVDGPVDPIRPNAVNQQWIEQLASMLTADGILIQNHLSPVTARSVARSNYTRKQFAHALLFHHPRYANGILGLYKHPVDIKVTRSEINRHIKQNYPGELKRLIYRVETIY